MVDTKGAKILQILKHFCKFCENGYQFDTEGGFRLNNFFINFVSLKKYQGCSIN